MALGGLKQGLHERQAGLHKRTFNVAAARPRCERSAAEPGAVDLWEPFERLGLSTSADGQRRATLKNAEKTLPLPANPDNMFGGDPVRPMDLHPTVRCRELSDRLSEGEKNERVACRGLYPEVVELGRQGHKVSSQSRREAFKELRITSLRRVSLGRKRIDRINTLAFAHCSGFDDRRTLKGRGVPVGQAQESDGVQTDPGKAGRWRDRQELIQKAGARALG